MKIAGLLLMVLLGVVIYSLIAVLGDKRSCCSEGQGKHDEEERKPFR